MRHGVFALLLTAALLAATEPADAARRRAVRHPTGPRPPVLSFYGDFIFTDGDRPAPLGLPQHSFTFETWMWLEKLEPSEFATIIGIDRWSLTISPAGRITSVSGISAPSPPPRRWTHIAFRSAASGVALLIDGVVVSTGPPMSVAVPSSIIYVAEYITGSFSQMRFWNVALSDDEIRRYSKERPEVGDPRIAAWWPMDDAAGTGVSTYFVRDLGPNAIHLGYAPPTRAQWVRPEVLESGPYFSVRSDTATEWAGLPLFVDFDRDGDLDLYTVQGLQRGLGSQFPYYTGDPPNPDRAFRNDGAGLFTDVSAEVLIGPRIQGYLCRGLFARDFNGDGLTDIFVTNAGPEYEEGVYAPNSIRIGTPEGTLINESAARISAKNTYDHRSAAGDLDGDGDIDVVSGGFFREIGAPHNTGGPVLLFFNDGAGNFSLNATQFPFVHSFYTSLALVDADLDGDLDLFLGDGGGDQRNTLALNDGQARFTMAPLSWLPPHRTFEHDCNPVPAPCRQAVHTIEPRDMNNDGILDLVVVEADAYLPQEDGVPVANWRNWKHTLQLLLGNGDGSFRDGSSRITTVWDHPGVIGSRTLGPYEGWLTLGVTLDQNSDGWPDLLVGSNQLSHHVLLINRGSAAFEEAGDLIPLMRGLNLLDSGDIDGDGDDDIAADGWVLKNLKPWKPNPFPQTNLRIRMSVTGGLTQTVDVDNTGPEAARQLSATIPVPHGYEWQAADGAGNPCQLQAHVVSCTRAQLDAGASWRIVVTSRRLDSAPIRATHALASASADVRENDLKDNVVRVPLNP